MYPYLEEFIDYLAVERGLAANTLDHTVGSRQYLTYLTEKKKCRRRRQLQPLLSGFSSISKLKARYIHNFPDVGLIKCYYHF